MLVRKLKIVGPLDRGCPYLHGRSSQKVYGSNLLDDSIPPWNFEGGSNDRERNHMIMHNAWEDRVLRGPH